MSSDKNKRLESVDVLRGIAALAVLLLHIRHNPAVPSKLSTLLWLPVDFGFLGVTLFLVISGFCIHLGTARRMALTGEVGSNWKRFWRRRFYRLYPPYVAAIALSLAVYYLCEPELYVGTPIVDLKWDLATHLTMLHNLFPAYQAALGNTVFWSLGLEEQLYALYAVYLFMRRRLPSLTTVTIILCVTMSWRLATANLSGMLGAEPLQLGGWLNWPFAFWGLWTLGALAAEGYAGVRRLPEWCHRYTSAAGFIALGVCTSELTVGRFGQGGLMRAYLGESALAALEAPLKAVTMISLPAFAAGFFVVLNRWARAESRGQFKLPGARSLAWVGLISYSLYLVHVPILFVFERLFPLGDGMPAVLLRYIILAPACLLFAALFFQIVEKRFLLTDDARPKRAEPPPAGEGLTVVVPAAPQGEF